VGPSGSAKGNWWWWWVWLGTLLGPEGSGVPLGGGWWVARGRLAGFLCVGDVVGGCAVWVVRMNRFASLRGWGLGAGDPMVRS
jgi:hypothetical protein